MPEYIAEHSRYYALSVGNAEQLRLIAVGDRNGSKVYISILEFIIYDIEVLECSEHRHVVSFKERVAT